MMPVLRFQYGKSRMNGEWYWRVRARNSEIVAEGEGYKRKESVLKVWKLLQAHMRDAELFPID
jgi:uncharacterized protein YegP (UPF0339 family)